MKFVQNIFMTKIKINFGIYSLIFIEEKNRCVINIPYIRKKLWKHEPHCKYCGQLTRLPENLGFKKGKKVKYPDDMATLDHVYSRLNPKREEGYNKYIFNLSCNLCNNYREKIESDNLSKEELWKRSGRKPLALR